LSLQSKDLDELIGLKTLSKCLTSKTICLWGVLNEWSIPGTWKLEQSVLVSDKLDMQPKLEEINATTYLQREQSIPKIQF
jgi:hypothetical protein